VPSLLVLVKPILKRDEGAEGKFAWAYDIANTCGNLITEAAVRKKHHAEFYLACPPEGRGGSQRLCSAGLERQPSGGT
jgi:hypothetical protein